MSGSLRFLLQHDRVVQAGAGTGKTHALLTQYLHLCAGLTAHRRAIPPQKICALTFTEKAAAEMRSKLVGRMTQICRQLSNSEDVDPVAALRETEPTLVETAEALDVAVPTASDWEQVLASLGSATISTFHSFAASLLRRYAQVLGLDPEFSLLNEDEASLRLRETCEELVLGAIEDPTSISDDPALRETMVRLLAELGFSSGAGGSGGLVEVLCQLYRQRAEEGKAADGMAAAYQPDQLCDELQKAHQRLSTTLHELGSRASELGEKTAERARVLDGMAHRLDEKLRSLDDLDACRPDLIEIRDTMKGLKTPSGAKIDPSLTAAIKDCRQQTYDALDDLFAIAISQKAAPLATGLALLLEPLMTRFAKVKQEEAVLDFSDLLRLSRDLLRDHPEVRHELGQRFVVFLVDEFQDTSPLQAELLTLLVGDEGHSPGRIYIVGDRKQSIYDFRGADVAAFAQLCQRLIAHGADEETLSRSYRSLPGVLDHVNTLFARVMQPPTGAMPDWFVRWEPERDPLSAHRSNPTDGNQVECLRALPPTERDDATPKQPAIVREAELLAQRVSALIDEGTAPGKIVVLLRRFTHLLHYTSALRRKRVPYYVVRGRGFFAAQEVLDLASLLRLIDDPTDLLALLAVLRSPLVGLSDESLTRLHLAGRLSLLALTEDRPQPRDDEEPDELQLPADLQLRLPADEMQRLLRCSALLRVLVAEADRLDPARLLRLALDHSDYLAILAADSDGEQRLANVERLLCRATAYAGKLRAFVRFVRLQTDPELIRTHGDPSDEPTAQVLGEHDNVVRIMTVHQSKGLEFSTVIVAGCTTRERGDVPQVVYDRDLGLGLSLYEDGERVMSLPQRRIVARRKLRAKAESDRLFYVAATRAKDRLIWVGESDRSVSGTWRQAIDELVSSQGPDGPIHEWQPSPQQLIPSLAMPPPTQQPQQARIESEARALYHPDQHAPMRTTLLGAQAAELCACPRRHHLLSLTPTALTRPQGRARTSDETMELSPFACLLAGTLPQRLLSRLDWRKHGSDLDEWLGTLGMLRDGPHVQEAVTWLSQLLRSRWLHGQLDAMHSPSLRRAVRYLVNVPGTAISLCGEFDAYWQDRDGTHHVLDVQLASPPTEESPWHRARRALLAHAAQQHMDVSEPISVGILYLQDADPRPKQTLEAATPLAPWLPQLAHAAIRPQPAHAVMHIERPAQTDCQALRCTLQRFCYGTVGLDA